MRVGQAGDDARQLLETLPTGTKLFVMQRRDEGWGDSFWGCCENRRAIVETEHFRLDEVMIAKSRPSEDGANAPR